MCYGVNGEIVRVGSGDVESEVAIVYEQVARGVGKLGGRRDGNISPPWDVAIPDLYRTPAGPTQSPW